MDLHSGILNMIDYEQDLKKAGRMKKLEFSREVAFVVTFLSRGGEPYTEQMSFGPYQYRNYTVFLHKVGVIPKDKDAKPAWEPIGEKRILQATDYLNEQFISRNVEPGHIVQIAQRNKQGDPSGVKPIWWEVTVADKKTEITEEEPGEIEKPEEVLGRTVCQLIKDIHNDLFTYFHVDAQTKGYGVDAAFQTLNMAVMTCVKDLKVTKY